MAVSSKAQCGQVIECESLGHTAAPLSLIAVNCHVQWRSFKMSYKSVEADLLPHKLEPPPRERFPPVLDKRNSRHVIVSPEIIL